MKHGTYYTCLLSAGGYIGHQAIAASHRLMFILGHISLDTVVTVGTLLSIVLTMFQAGVALYDRFFRHGKK